MDEMNSAEREAERILMDAATGKNECPDGMACAIHNRVEGAVVEESMKFAQYLNYVGEYCVITTDHALVGSLLEVISKATGQPFPRFETVIWKVGKGTLGDLALTSEEHRANACRYVHEHDSWERMRDEHNVTVSGLESGLIDVSKPMEF